MFYWEDPYYFRKSFRKGELEGRNKKSSLKGYPKSAEDIDLMTDMYKSQMPLTSDEYIFAKIIRKSEVESHSKEKDPFLDVIEYRNKTIVLIELLGITKEDVKINFYGHKLEIFANSQYKKYKGIIKMSFNIGDDKIICNYNNSLLEVILKK